MRLKRTFSSASAAALVGLLLAACSASSTDSPDYLLSSEQIKAMADEQARLGHDGQADILSDGVVSAAEYDSAFQELRRCLEAAGFEVTAPLISPVNGFTYEYVADFGDREMSGALKDLDSCEASHFSSVARAFSLSNIPEMESSLARAVFDCLERKGLDTRGDEANLRQFVESVGEEAALSCTLESAQVLFPDYPSLTVGY